MRPTDQPNAVPCTGEGFDPLPVVRGDMDGRPVLLSRWHLSWSERLYALLTGAVWLLVYGTDHPPVRLQVNSPSEPEAIPSRKRFWRLRHWLHRRTGIWFQGIYDGHGREEHAPPLWPAGRFITRVPRRGERAGWVEVAIEWTLGRWRTLGASFSFGGGDDDDEAQAHVSVPLLSLFLSFENWLPRRWRPRQQQEASLFVDLDSESVAGLAVRWRLWTDPWCWERSRPRWREGTWWPLDTLLGRHRYTTRDLSITPVRIPLPERVYDGTVRLLESTWQRPRWPWPKRLIRAEVSVPDGVPIPGKGESSYDQGQDAVYSLTTPASTVPVAIAALVRDVLDTRSSRASLTWRPAEPVSAPQKGAPPDTRS